MVCTLKIFDSNKTLQHLFLIRNINEHLFILFIREIFYLTLFEPKNCDQVLVYLWIYNQTCDLINTRQTSHQDELKYPTHITHLHLAAKLRSMCMYFEKESFCKMHKLLLCWLNIANCQSFSDLLNYSWAEGVRIRPHKRWMTTRTWWPGWNQKRRKFYRSWTNLWLTDNRNIWYRVLTKFSSTSSNSIT